MVAKDKGRLIWAAFFIATAPIQALLPTRLDGSKKVIEFGQHLISPLRVQRPFRCTCLLKFIESLFN